jgi:hypothetical protein
MDCAGEAINEGVDGTGAVPRKTGVPFVPPPTGSRMPQFRRLPLGSERGKSTLVTVAITLAVTAVMVTVTVVAMTVTAVITVTAERRRVPANP